MNTKAIDLVRHFKAIQEIEKSEYLDHSQRIQIFKEMKYELPPEMYCNACSNTRKILKSLLEEKSSNANQAKKKTTRKSASKAKAVPEKSHPKEQSLLFDIDVHPRGEGVEETVVNQAPKKRRQASRGS